MAFDCLFYLKMSFLAKNAKLKKKNEKLIKKLRNHSVDTCLLKKTWHSLEAKPLGSRGQSSRKPLGLSHIKKQNQHSESPVFVSELLLLLLFSSILLTFSAIRNFFFWERRSRAPVDFEDLVFSIFKATMRQIMSITLFGGGTCSFVVNHSAQRKEA